MASWDEVALWQGSTAPARTRGRERATQIEAEIFIEMEIEDCKIFHLCQETGCSFKTSWDFALNHHTKKHHQIKSSSKSAGFDCRKLLCDSWDYESSFKVNFDSYLKSYYNWTSQKILRTPKDEELLKHGGTCEKCGFESASNFLSQIHNFRCSSVSCSELKTEILEEIIKVEEPTILVPNNNIPDPSDCMNKHGVYQCNFCGYASRVRYNFVHHRTTQHLSARKLHWNYCPFCKYKCKSSDQMKKHVRTCVCTKRNSDLQKYGCANCNFRTHLKSSIRYHTLAVHTADKYTKYHRCSQCTYKSKRTTHLRSHVLSQHTPDEALKMLQCDRCSYKTKISHYYQKHCKFAHASEEDIEWFHCALCPYKSRRKWDLQLHIERHGRNSVYIKCDICGYKTRQKERFKKHVDEVHKEESSDSEDQEDIDS